MPGRKTANKCGTCRRRKIKCGLQEPACIQCVKGGWVCPGYEIESRFHAYNGNNDNTALRSSNGTATPSTSATMEWLGHMRWIAMIPPSKEDSLRNELVFKITFNAVAARLMVVSNSDILEQIPARVGRSRALDDAVVCICRPPASEKQSPPIFPSRQYATALTSLQQSLKDGKESVATETLAAATLLQMYEHATNHSKHSWIAHANGVIRMLELRGPSRIENELERAILRAEVGNILINAIRDDTKCFLADPAWREILFPKTLFTSGKTNSAFAAIIDVGIVIPGLLQQFKQYNLNARGQDTTFTGKQLIVHLRDTHRRALKWQLRHDSDQTERKRCVGVQSDRLAHAARVSWSTFLITLLYMLLEVSNSDIPQDMRSDLMVFMIRDDAALRPHVALFQDLSASVYREVGALTAEDTLAAANTVWLMRRMLEEVLSVPHQPLLEDIRRIMEDLLDGLDNVLEPMRNLSRTGSRAIATST